ncbi:MAG: ABC transporter permease [Paenibacillus sp. RIFOXYA1_FULL_44_5]|nr:MAG: ABC transporter permease [Paenibacillus sp. RIFOXYA1_FULL_44_5]
MIQSKSEKVFAAANYILLFLLSCFMLLPFIHILAKSFSSEVYVLSKEVTFWPKGFILGAYEYVLNNKQFLYSFSNSVIVTVGGTAISMFVTIITAYPLAKQDFPSRRYIMFLYVVTMFFSGGIVPTYLVIKELGLINTLWSLMLPVAVVPFNLILLKNFFANIPSSLEESAKIDGASNLRILFSIYVPLSKAAIATVSMFYTVSYWNNFFNALMYISERRLIPLQVYLMEIIMDQKNISLANVESLTSTAPESVRAATIIAAIVPILLVYPFVQKYFVQGIMLGAVKG